MLRVRRPGPALLISLIALFASLGGGAYAAVSINGKNIKSRSITAKKIKKSTITGAEVGKNKLTGADIAEGKLAKVPTAAKADSASSAGHATTATNASNAANAAHATSATSATSASHATTATSATTATTATNAAAVDGASVIPIYFRSANVIEEVLNVGGLVLSANCGGGDLDLNATTTEDNASIRFAGVAEPGVLVARGDPNQSFDTGETFPVFSTTTDNQVEGTLTYTAATPDAGPTGANVVTVQLRADEIPGGGQVCEVSGNAISARKPLP